MTHAFLKSVAFPTAFAAQLEDQYLPLAFCYEHKTDTAGHVYEANALEQFIADHDIDPITAPEQFSPPKNIVDLLVREVSERNMIIIKAAQTIVGHPIILENYNKYEIFGKKELVMAAHFQPLLYGAKP